MYFNKIIKCAVFIGHHIIYCVTHSFCRWISVLGKKIIFLHFKVKFINLVHFESPESTLMRMVILRFVFFKA